MRTLLFDFILAILIISISLSATAQPQLGLRSQNGKRAKISGEYIVTLNPGVDPAAVWFGTSSAFALARVLAGRHSLFQRAGHRPDGQ